MRKKLLQSVLRTGATQKVSLGMLFLSFDVETILLFAEGFFA